MKIWFVEIGEPLPVEENVRLHRYGLFSKYLAAKGHDVTLWTSTFSHAPKKNFFNEDTIKIIDGVKINFLYGDGYKKNISFARINHQKNFAKKAFNKMSNDNEKPDIIITGIPTIEGASMVKEFSIKNNVPYIVDFRDFWPDDLVNLLPKPLRFFGKILLTGSYKSVEKVVRSSSFIMGSSKKLVDYAGGFSEKSVSKDKYVMPHGYPEIILSEHQIQQGIKFWNEMGINSNTFNVCFFGTIGNFFNFDTVINAIRDNNELRQINFVLCGNGSKKDYYQNLAYGLDNVLFPGWVNQEQIISLMKISKVGLAPYIESENFELPNKVFEYMAGELAVVSSLGGSFKTLLSKNSFGYSYNPDSIEEFSEKLLNMYSYHDKSIKMAKSAHELFIKKFRQTIIFDKAEKYFIEKLK
jgi:glycosyltransferase involved in cell wall biosynthesis